MTILNAPRTSIPPARGAIAAMYAGLALTLIAVLAVVVDQATSDSLASHILHTYPNYTAAELNRDKGVLLTYMFSIGAVGAVSWLGTIWAVKRRKRWARGTATTIFVLACGISLFNLLVEEYGNTVLPTSLAVPGALPCLAGLVAVVLMWTGNPGPGRTRD